MALQAVYKQFLAAPNSAALAQNASLHYITTTTSFHGPTDIIKHLNAQRNQIKKNKEDILDVVEGPGALAVQTGVSLEFLDHGGAYLPGLDDQFLSDRVVDIPVVSTSGPSACYAPPELHRPCLSTIYSQSRMNSCILTYPFSQFHVVKFDSDGKINTIQQSWDQGALLKQLDVIGKTGRNWPIRDSQEQIKLITRSRGQAAGPTPSQTVQRSRENSTNALRDPHATLHNTGLSRPAEDEPSRIVSPFSGTRPRQRTFEEILGDEVDLPEHESPSRAVAPKIGAGKNFQPSRLFDKPEDAPPEPDSPDDAKAPQRFMKPHPMKYNHFDFADGTDPADAPQAGIAIDAVKSKHRSQWDFEDFVTPQKPKPSKMVQQQQIRHWGTDENDIDESPAKGPAPGKPRRDAESQIELQDDGEEDQRNQRAGARPRGAMHNAGLGLYKNHMVSDDGSEPIQSPDARALGNITNLKNRSKIFDPHFNSESGPSLLDIAMLVIC